jgi:hypothetical protein
VLFVILPTEENLEIIIVMMNIGIGNITVLQQNVLFLKTQQFMVKK